HPLLAQEDDRGLHVAVRLLEGALAVHHPGARALPELADELGGDLRHQPSTSVAAREAAAGAEPSSAGASPLGTGVVSPSVAGSTASPAATCSVSPCGTGSSSAAGASASCAAAANSRGETFCLPSATASAIARAT